jgi:hypothetical protein
MLRLTLVLAGAMAVGGLSAAPSASADQREPTPKELWDAYPLHPEDSTPMPTPGSDAPTAVATPRADAGQEEGGMPWFVPIMLAVPLMIAVGIVVVEWRARHPATEPAEPLETRRATFDWRLYPPPARPAPPPPPTIKGGER